MSGRAIDEEEAGAAGATAGAGASNAPDRKPGWLKKPIPKAGAVRAMERLLRERNLHTVCESALCPNLGECFGRGTATFLILGDVCTRDCAFCGVCSGEPTAVDPAEPDHVADAVARLALRHVVITSVTRDDLPDGGAGHYAATIRAVRARCPEATVEVLVPDFLGRVVDLDIVLAERPAVFNHNVETVPRLYAVVRPQASYERSLAVLAHASNNGAAVVKTGLMVGLGEEEGEVEQVIREAADAGVVMVTIGQYLQPSKTSVPVARYVAPPVFERYRQYGETLGLQMHAAPFVRSSFQAGQCYEQAVRRHEAGDPPAG